MARISMRNVQKSSVSEYFALYLSSAAARGVKDKTLQTYKNHFRSIAKRMDVSIPMNRLNSRDLPVTERIAEALHCEVGGKEKTVCKRHTAGRPRGSQMHAVIFSAPGLQKIALLNNL